jgi:hypothetical protein
MDFTELTATVTTNAALVLTALGAVAAVKIGPGVVKWGFNKVIGWFR